MKFFVEHDVAVCPECGEPLYYGTKEEASGWKVYYECGERCGWECMAGWIRLADIDSRDDVDVRARELGSRWA